MKALITGATGFIGSHLAEELLGKGYSVACLVRDPSRLKWIEGLDVRIIEGDCTDKVSLFKAVESAGEVDMVFHLAALTKAPRDEDFFEVNVAGTENVLKALHIRGYKIKRFVFLSSLAAIGPSRTGRPVDEECRPDPVSSYGKSKLQAERIVLEYSRNMPVTIIRSPAVYGPRDTDFRLLYTMVEKGVFPIWGKCRYSLLYVDDLVRAIIRSAESPEAAGEVFFVSDDSGYTNEEIARAISEALGKKPVMLRIPHKAVPIMANIGSKLGKNAAILKDRARELGHSNWTCDSSKAARVLGFESKIKITEGMKWTANWYRIHRWL